MSGRKTEKCNCGHDHHDHHEHHECCGGHDHHECCGHHHHDVEEKKELTSHAKKTIYTIENIDCANCASKIEKKINELPEVEEAILTFATKQLQVASDSEKDLLPLLQKACDSVEDGVVTKEKKRSVKALREEKKEENKKGEIISIGIGAALFIAGVICNGKMEIVPIVLFVLSYLILGGGIVLTAGKNLLKGRVFDENFLMSLATLSAFAIGEFSEAVGVMLFYRIGELFEHIAVERSRSQIMEAVDLRPEVVNRMTGEKVEVIPSEDAQVGDIVLVRAGDRIPLDSVIVEGESQIDTSAVTGEPVPVKVKVGEKVTSGCVNLTGVLKVKVEKVLEDSMVTRILNSVENAASSKPKIDRFITKFARVYTPFVVGLALATAILPSIFTGNWEHWIYTAITFLVISCPCALVLSVPLAFFSGIGAGSKRGILFKGGVALEALKDVNFSVEQGEYVAIMGESGSGKSTLLNILAALDKTTEGKVFLKEKDLSKVKEKEMAAFRRNNLGFVFQDFNLLDTFSLKDNIFLPLVLSGTSYREMERRLLPLADKLGIKNLLEKYPYEVSGGQKQRAAVARAVITQPQLLLADEPTGALDSKAAKELLRLFTHLNQDGQTILMVTHSVKAASTAGRVLFIKDGKVFHQIYKGSLSEAQMYQKISDTMTAITAGGEDDE